MWYRSLLTFFFPPRCVSCREEGAVLCNQCTAQLRTTPQEIEPGIWALSQYHHTVTERLIRAMKYEGKKELADTTGVLLSKAPPHILHGIFDGVVLVPIPSSPSEHRGRGYDHIALMAHSLSLYTKIPLVPALEKIRETERQVKMQSREDRMKNLERAFRQKKVNLQGKTLVLIDDVTTTGATFREAKRALANSGAKHIVCLAIAH